MGRWAIVVLAALGILSSGCQLWSSDPWYTGGYEWRAWFRSSDNQLMGVAKYDSVTHDLLSGKACDETQASDGCWYAAPGCEQGGAGCDAVWCEGGEEPVPIDVVSCAP